MRWMLAALWMLTASSPLGCEAAKEASDGDADGDSDSDSDSDADSDADSDVDSDADSDADSDSDGDGDTECGEADYLGDPLAIPDGVGMSYETTLTITGFGDGATLPNATGIIAVCVNMEHSWIRDLQIELVPPSGPLVVLNQFLGQTGSEIYLGEANDSDDYDPIPGIGWTYCWTPTATNLPMLDWWNVNMGEYVSGTMPADNYQASSTFDPAVGCDLNGAWTVRCTDDWGIDNGYIFWWSIQFDQSLIPDCDDWVIE
jgi:hypothetical protein